MSVTASNSRVSQVSHHDFERIDKYRSQNALGYQVCASRKKVGWCFIASGPKEKAVMVDGLSTFDGHPYKVSYELGDVVPPATDYRTKSARRLLGIFHDNDYGSVDDARHAAQLACVQDSER